MLMVVGAAAATPTQDTGPPRPRFIPRSVAGEDLFQFFCATCHGRDGKGRGPAAAALKNPPPDLTRLARQYQGRFPRERVEAYVAHDEAVVAPGHGSREMPVWGPIFHGLEPSDELTAVRIANVVRYVESIQEK